MKRFLCLPFLFALLIIPAISNAQLPSPAEQKMREIKEAYINTVKKYAAKEFSEWNEYFLFDITNDSIPELWVRDGTCEADYEMLVFTFQDGTVKKIHTTEAGHSSFHLGDNYVLKNMVHMGYQLMTKIYYNGEKIVEKTTYESSGYFEDADYKTPVENNAPTCYLSNTREIENVFEILELKEQLKEKERIAKMSRKKYPDECTVQLVDPEASIFKWMYGVWYNPRENRYIVLTPKNFRNGKKLTDIPGQKPLRLTSITNHPYVSEYLIINDGDSLNLYADEARHVIFSEIEVGEGQEKQIETWTMTDTYSALQLRIALIIAGIVLVLAAIIVGIILLARKKARP